MSLEAKVMEGMKDAMKTKNEALLRALRAIKAEIIKAKTEPGANGAVTEEGELKLLQRMAKQRKDSLEVFTTQGRADLAQKEQEELDIIEQFLPKQLGADELKVILEKIITEVGAAGPQDMGKVMGVATKQLAGQADGKVVSALVKELLAK
ncbi:MAG: GatB/YqeY domain-containing protein [Chitinophagaceae bacterium]|nr:GatB/YqeY domain-containing protein [Chitinophagaceae bacterium]